MIQSRTPPVVDDTYYPVSDGQPVGETPRHVNNLFYVLYPLREWYADDPLAFVAANMFVYYEKGNKHRHVSPDIYVSLGIRKDTDPPRECYLLWNEGKGLDVVIEFTSKSTVKKDCGHKRDIYRDVLQVREYFLFDPTGECLNPPLQGQRLVNGVYETIQPVEGRLPSEVLRLHLETDGGDLLRFWNPATEQWLLIPPEFHHSLTEEMAARLRAEAERAAELQARQRAEAERAAEQQARQRAEAERATAQKARQRAEAARVAEQEARQRAEAARVAEQEARQRAEAARVAEQEARQRAEAERVAEQEARQRAEAARVAEQEARQRAEAERVAEREAGQQAIAEVERLRRELEELRQRKPELT